MVNEEAFTIRFEYESNIEGKYAAESHMAPNYECGETALVLIGVQLQSFLRQIGYYRPNEYTLMDDLTEEEMWYLRDCLHEYRDNVREDKKVNRFSEEKEKDEVDDKTETTVTRAVTT